MKYLANQFTATPGEHSETLTHFYSSLRRDTGPIAIELHFQDGPIQEFGVNGTTNEELIKLLIARLNSLDELDNGKFKCYENTLAIANLQAALDALEERTRQRKLRGVEGTTNV